MNGIRTLFVLALLIWAGATAAAQNVVYVRLTGNDVNNGATPAAANRTIVGALADAQAGDIIDIGDGDFDGANIGYNVTLRGANAGIAFANWGAATTITSAIAIANPGVELYVEGIAFGAITPIGGASTDARVTFSGCRFTESNTITTEGLGWNELAIVSCTFDGNADNAGANLQTAVIANGLQLLYVTESTFDDYSSSAVNVAGTQVTVKIISNDFTACNTAGATSTGAVTLQVAGLTGAARVNKNLFTACSNGLVTTGALSGKDVTAQYNRFASTSNGYFAIKNAGTGLLSASCNNYGTDAGGYTFGGGGANDIYIIVGGLLSGSIEAGPFNLTGTDVGGLVPGFEPDPNQQCEFNGPITTTSSSKSYFRVQDGIDASASGAVVTLAGNSAFTGNVTIAKDLTLRGSDTSAVGPKTVWSTVNGTITISLASETVKLVGLKITSPTATTLVSNSSGTRTTINRCWISVDPSTEVASVPTNGAIHHVRSGELYLWSNKITRPVAAGAEGQQYIRALTFATANVNRVAYIEANTIEGTLQFSNLSLLSAVTVKDNTISDAGVDGVSVTSHTVRTLSITGNTISNSRENGIAIRGSATVGSNSATITGNYITGSGASGTSFAAVNISSASSGTQSWNDNHIASQAGSNKTFINGRSSYTPVATCNWWGVTSEDDITSRITGNVAYDQGGNGWRGAGGNSAAVGYVANGPGSACTIRSFTISLAATNISCNGQSDGAIVTTLSGTTPTPTYTWTKSGSVYTANTKDISGLTAGTYNVSINNGTGNVRAKSQVITEPPAITSSSAVTSNYNGSHLSCNGASDGAITVTASGGTSTLTYSKDGSNFQTSNVFTGLAAGTYTLTTKDVNGCTNTSSATITAPAAVTITSAPKKTYNGSELSCATSTDGEITVNATGGTGTLQYSKNDGGAWQTSKVFSGLAAGTYAIKVKDANTCSTSVSVTITAPSAITSSSAVTSNYNGSHLSCNGASDGAITVTASGGTSTLTYSKDGSNFQTSNVFTGLAAGTYTLTTKDVNGCTNTSSATITAPAAVTITSAPKKTYNGSELSCATSTDGEITVNATGGTGTLQYSKNDGGAWQTSKVFSGLAAGTYAIKVKDANTCSTSVSVTITAPSAITSSSAVTSNYNGSHLSCNGASDGAITVTASGGTSTLTYSKDGSNFQTSNVFTGLAAGTYTLTTKDVNGCTNTSSATITAPAAVTITSAPKKTYNGSELSCATSTDGEITVNATGGTGTLQYSKNDGGAWQTSKVFSGLAAGTYAIKVKDANTCSTSVSVTITAPSAITSSSAVTSNYNGSHLSCNGASDGAITVTASGGTSTLTYSKDGSNFQTSNVFTGLAAGTYTLTTKDVNGCTNTSSATITAPAAVTITSAPKKTYNGSELSCATSTDGEITVNATGGTGTLQYSKNDGGAWQTSKVFSGLAAGTYAIKVKDANTCSTSVSVTITAPSAITSSSAVTSNYNGSHLSCNGASDGAITVTASGGTSTLTYSKDGSNFQTSNVFTGLAAGTYTLTTKDVNGCTNTSSATITAPAAVTITSAPKKTYNGSELSCATSTDGEITVNATGGTGTLQYSKNDGGAWQTSKVFSGLAAGTYAIKVKDANTCSTSVSVTITAPSAITSSSAVTSNYNGSHLSCNGASDGAITVTASGGTSTLTYSKDGSNFQTSNVFTGLAAGTYTLTTKDVNGCTNTSSATITAPAAVTITSAPKKTYNGSELSCATSTDGEITVNATGGTGTLQYSKNDGGAWQTSKVFSGLAAGTYAIKVKDANTCSTSVSVTITAPSAITSSSAVTSNYNGSHLSCNGASDGAITVTASGGTSTLTYSKDGSNFQTSNVFTGLAAGTYTLTTKDVNGCTNTSSATITAPAAVTITSAPKKTYNGSELSCATSTDGEITVNATGGTGTLQYSKNDGGAWQTSKVFSGLAAGTYAIKVKDANTCSTSVSVTITAPSAITSSSAVTSNYNGSHLSCNGASDGVITVTASGGTSTLTYSKDGTNFQTSNVFTGLAAGTYTLTTKDVNGCTNTSSAMITAPAAVSITSAPTTKYNGSELSCATSTDGEITVNATGGTGTLEYSKNNGGAWQTSKVFSGLAAGTYAIKVKDANTCSTSVSVTITAPSAITSSSAVTSNYNGSHLSCNGASDGAITVTASGGTSTLTYSKDGSNFQTSNVFTGLAAGTYTLTTKDVNGCTNTSSATITAPAAVTITSAPKKTYNGSELSCATSTDGEITVNATGGTGTLEYSKNNGGAWQTSNVFSGLAAGTYAIKVKDANTCSTSVSVTITAPSAVVINGTSTKTYNGSQLSCSTSSDGEITVNATGGTGALQYSKDNGSNWQTSNVFAGLAAGTYSIRAKDVNACSTSVATSVTITAPTAINALPVVTSNYNGSQLTCPNSADGSISSNPSGGTGSYTYLWEKKSGEIWNEIASTENVSGQSAGDYRVTVKDANLCAVTKTVTIIPPSGTIIVSTSKLSYNGADLSCYNSTDGQITVTADGGTGSKTYSKDGGANYQTSNVFTGLGAGTYSMIVKDVNNCTSSPTNVTISAPTQITVSSLTTNGPKNAGQAIEFTAVVTGGTQFAAGDKYTYSWAKPRSAAQTPVKGAETVGASVTQKFSIATTAANDNGQYTLTVTDQNGCTQTASVTIIIYPSTLYVATTGNDATGDGRDVNPLRTIQKANDVALSGNTIEVQSGTFDESPVISKTLTVNGTSSSLLGSGRYFVFGTTNTITWGANWLSSVFNNVGVNASGSLATGLAKVNAGSSNTLWVIGNHTLTSAFTVDKQITVRGATSSAAIATYTGCDIVPPASITLAGATSADTVMIKFTGSSTKSVKDLTLVVGSAGKFFEVPSGATGNVDPVTNVRYEWDNDDNAGTAVRKLYGVTNGSYSGGEKYDVAKFVYDAADNGYGAGRVYYYDNGPLPWSDLVIGWKAEDGGSATNLARIKTLEPMKSDVKLQSLVLQTRRPTLYTPAVGNFNTKTYMGFDGVDEYLESNTTTDINGGDNKTMFLVFAPVDGANAQVIYKHGDNQKGLSIVQLADGKISLNIYNDTDNTAGNATHESWIYNAPADNTVLIAQIYFNGTGTNNATRRVGAALDNSAGRIADLNHVGGEDYVAAAEFNSTTLATPAIAAESQISLGCASGAYYYGSWDGTNVVHNSSTAADRTLYFGGKATEAIMLSTADEGRRDAVYCYLRNKYFSGDQTISNGLDKISGDAIAGEAPFEPDMAAWPNPAENDVQVEIAVPTASYVTVTMHDALGRDVKSLYEGNVASNSVLPIRIDVRNLPNGIYVINATGVSDTQLSTTLVVRH